uniref:AlNc14C166G7887 protein n=1 Tax=Albugo laibachii Nc14 TaxID=890382 RepID=F0WN54_9STRA|nr:AlNc14C166G7887 [Albugo laibachii Nc14]|eukprot:CCA22743.1 AlNc14C166G7887 [Albugo laibachii Nc14]
MSFGKCTRTPHVVILRNVIDCFIYSFVQLFECLRRTILKQSILADRKGKRMTRISRSKASSTDLFRFFQSNSSTQTFPKDKNNDFFLSV